MPRRALVYNPDLATLGGGEHVMLAIAAVLERTYDLTIGGPVIPTAAQFSRRGLRTDFRAIAFPERNIWRHTRHVELLVYINNHLPFPSLARRNLLIVQFPFPSSYLRRLVGVAALRQYQCVVYSEYVQRHLQRLWHRDSAVLAPPVRRGHHDPETKEDLILAVGRFFRGGHSKRQDILVESYRRLPESISRRWPLVLAGGVSSDRASRGYVDSLRRSAQGLNIEIRTDVSQDELDGLFRRARLFWHATGYGRSTADPGKAEHFGISTIEAMSWGAVPLVYDDGGSRELVDVTTGRRWTSIDDLVASTTDLIRNAECRDRLADAGVRRSAAFDECGYEDRLVGLLEATSRA